LVLERLTQPGARRSQIIWNGEEQPVIGLEQVLAFSNELQRLMKVFQDVKGRYVV
jgi:hypothetical protein